MSRPQRLSLTILSFVLGLSSLVANASGSVNPYPITPEDTAFLKSLKNAIVAGDERWIAARVSFPISANIDGVRRTIENQRDFVVHYKEIINEKVRTAVIKQDPDGLFKNWRGTMIGAGAIWFTEVITSSRQSHVFIIGINN